MDKEFVSRYDGNPILTKDNVPYKVETVHNVRTAQIDEQVEFGLKDSRPAM